MPRKETLKAADVAAALNATSGLVYMAADRLGVSAQTVYNYANRYAAVKEAIAHQKGKRLDSAEGMLWQAVLKGEAWAVCFYLKTQGKARGYVERQEVRSVRDDEIESAIESELARMARSGQDPNAGTAEGEDDGEGD